MQTLADQLVSIVLPVSNQAGHIQQTVDDYERALTQARIHHETLLVVNDSIDASLERCHALAAAHSTVRVIVSQTGGWGLAVKLGLAAARGNLICYTNSARTTAQELILALLYAMANPNVVIKANRRIRENWKRRLGSLLYNIECRALFDLANWDINGTPKVFPRAFGHLLQLTYENDLIDLEFDVVCRRKGYPMLEVPIFSSRRHGGTSTTGYRSACRMYVGAYRHWLRVRGGDRG